MNATTFRIGLVLVASAVATSALGASAGEQYASGQALLAKGDFDGALAALAAAARTDSKNEAYLQEYTMVRRIVQLRQAIDSEADPQRWEYLARALHSFYVSRGLLEEAVVLDRKIHARLNNASSAVLLAETELALNHNTEAAEVLQRLDGSQSTPATQTLLGIALARLGKTGEARRAAKSVSLSEDAGPRMTYAVARLYAATGDSDAALQTLGRLLESVPPTVQAGYRQHAQRCPDFQGLAPAPFAQVLQTKSKIPESECSGGAGCSGCPMRGKCPSSQGH
ncbi:MAG: hypothetical protein HUU20_05945 [Pirellulales bacterium]|nr:hypothetical protein [Pirellulales bacterium]